MNDRRATTALPFVWSVALVGLAALFGAIKSEEQQSVLTVHRGPEHSWWLTAPRK